MLLHTSKTYTDRMQNVISKSPNQMMAGIWIKCKGGEQNKCQVLGFISFKNDFFHDRESTIDYEIIISALILLTLYLD